MGYFLASTLVSSARDALGLSRCTHMYTGAAPITKETLEYFGSIGIKILELYGTSMAISTYSSVGSTQPGCLQSA